MSKKQSLFFAPISKKLAASVSISSPCEFRQSINRLKKGGISMKEKKALVLAQNRAKAQLRRKDLSMKEREEFTRISLIRIPRANK